jgi:hypothetical protein
MQSAFVNASALPMHRRHPELAHCLTLEVELDQHRWLVANDPAIMSGLDDDDLRSRELDRAAVGVLDIDLAISRHYGINGWR